MAAKRQWEDAGLGVERRTLLIVWLHLRRMRKRLRCPMSLLTRMMTTWMMANHALLHRVRHKDSYWNARLLSQWDDGMLFPYHQTSNQESQIPFWFWLCDLRWWVFTSGPQSSHLSNGRIDPSPDSCIRSLEEVIGDIHETVLWINCFLCHD